MSALASVLSLISIIFLYLFPAVIAEARKHKNKTAITLLNLFLGWSVIGWIVALIWSATDNVNKEGGK